MNEPLLAKMEESIRRLSKGHKKIAAYIKVN